MKYDDLYKDFGLEEATNITADPRQSGKDAESFGVIFDHYRLRGDLVRANQRKYAMALLKLNTDIPGAEDIGLARALIEQAGRPTGLALIIGAWGSGKSTLASLHEHINTAKSGHIITIEDPVEYPLT